MTRYTPSIAALFIATAMVGQTDTTNQGLDDHTLEIGVGKGKGLYAEVNNTRDTTGLQPDTINITTKRKVITIVTRKRQPEDWTEQQRQDSIAEAKRELTNQMTNWAGLDIGLNNFISPDNGFDLKGDEEFMELDLAASRFFAINFWEQKFEFGTPQFGLFTGAGLEFTSYKFKNNISLAYNSDSTFAIENYTDTAGNAVQLVPDLNKNKLRQIGIRVPLMLEMNTSQLRKRSFHLAAGVIGSLYFDTMYKQKFSQDGEKQKVRDKGDYNLLPYRLAASVRVGYGSLNLFAEYALTSLFEDGKGPELTPVNVGITLLAF